jgi:NAD(P)-dependent dehydrogenase (short-subunit alcohol dehydrogenase family)
MSESAQTDRTPGLRGKVALVTGAGSGIGRATAVVLGQAGVLVAVADWESSGGHETVAMVRDAGGVADYYRVDVSRGDQVRRAVGEVLSRHGQLHCAVNCAGIRGSAGPLVEQDEEDFDKVIAVNLRGVFLCMKHEIAAMLKQGEGAIVNVASVLGVVASAGAAAYAASKHGVVGLTRGAALDNARTGIRVNAVCPGVIDTPMAQQAYRERGLPMASNSSRVPVGRLGRPEEVAYAIRWLCSPESSYITGAVLPVDGAITAQ